MNCFRWAIFDMDRAMATLRLLFNWTRIEIENNAVY